MDLGRPRALNKVVKFCCDHWLSQNKRSIESTLNYHASLGLSASVFGRTKKRLARKQARELNVDLQHPYYGAFYLCMTPRGFADRGCGYWGATYGISGGIPDTVRLEFWLAGDSTSVLLLPMGQVIG